MKDSLPKKNYTPNHRRGNKRLSVVGHAQIPTPGVKKQKEQDFKAIMNPTSKKKGDLSILITLK